MTAATLLDWDTLDPGQVRTLILSPAPLVAIGAELLAPDLSVIEDITGALKISGDVHWAADATVHRDAEFTIARELNWGDALVRLRYSMTDPISGLAAVRDIGAFCTHTPDQVLGESLLDPGGDLVLAWSVQGQDRLYLLDRQVGRSYVVPATTNAYLAFADLFTAAGLSAALIDSAAQTKFTPTDMTWPLVPGTVAGSVDDGDGGPTTWLQIVNDLCRMCAFAPVWCDHHGYYRIGPDVPAGTVAPLFGFDALDPADSTIAPPRTRSLDQYAAPNRWIFTRDNLPSGVPPVVGAGLYIVDNLDDGPSSQDARGMVWPTQVSLTAIDQDALVAQGDLRVAADKRTTATFEIVTPPFPCAGHRDVLTLTDVYGTTRVQATEWRLPLDGGQTEWTLEQI